MIGLVIVIPLASILWLIDVSIIVLTGPLSQLFGFKLNTFNGVVFSVLVLWGIGALVRQVVNRSLFPKIEAFIIKVPLVSIVYRSLRQIASLVLKRRQQFLSTVFVEYPSKGIWSLGFITNENVQCLKDDENNLLVDSPVAVFIPSTPNPTNGIFVFVDEKQIQYSKMSVEEGIKCLMSAGMITLSLELNHEHFMYRNRWFYWI